MRAHSYSFITPAAEQWKTSLNPIKSSIKKITTPLLTNTLRIQKIISNDKYFQIECRQEYNAARFARSNKIHGIL